MRLSELDARPSSKGGFLASLRDRARAKPRTVAFPEGTETRVCEAVAEIQRAHLLEPVLIGSAELVRDGLSDAGADVGRVEVVDPDAEASAARYVEALAGIRGNDGFTPNELHQLARAPLTRAGLMVRLGEVHGALAGALHPTAEVVRAGLRLVGPDADIDTVSSAFYMVVPPFRGPDREVLTFTDAGVVPDPDSEQLAEIALAAARARRAIVEDEPVVAFLSYSTRGSAKGPSIEKVRAALDRLRELAPDLRADGELQADAALIAPVAARKARGSASAGSANVLVFPDLNSANIAYKLVQRLAGAAALGPVVQGLARPWNDVSRGASAEDIVHVACITSLMAGQ